MLWAHFFDRNVLSYLRIFVVCTKWHFTLKYVILSINLNNTTYEAK